MSSTTADTSSEPYWAREQARRGRRRTWTPTMLAQNARATREVKVRATVARGPSRLEQSRETAAAAWQTRTAACSRRANEVESA